MIANDVRSLLLSVGYREETPGTYSANGVSVGVRGGDGCTLLSLDGDDCEVTRLAEVVHFANPLSGWAALGDALEASGWEVRLYDDCPSYRAEKGGYEVVVSAEVDGAIMVADDTGPDSFRDSKAALHYLVGRALADEGGDIDLVQRVIEMVTRLAAGGVTPVQVDDDRMLLTSGDVFVGLTCDGDDIVALDILAEVGERFTPQRFDALCSWVEGRFNI